MIVIIKDRVKAVRKHKRLTGKELALLAGVDQSEISLVEGGRRTPRADTIEKVAFAFDVSIDFIMGKEDADVALPLALSRQSLRLFLRERKVSEHMFAFLRRVCEKYAAPQSVKDWRELVEILQEFGSMAHLKSG